MSWTIIGYVILAAAANVVGGLIIFLKRDWSERGVSALMALSAGLLIAITVLDLIPEVMKRNESSPIFILGGLVFLFLIQQYVAPRVTKRDGKESDGPNRAVAGSVLGMVVHAFFDGFSIITSFGLNFSLGLTVFIALLLHKIPAGVTVSSLVFSLTLDKKRGLISTVFMAISTLVGGSVGFILTDIYLPNEGTLALILAVTAGILLYVGAADLLPSVAAKRDRLVSWFVVIGIVIFFLLQQIIGQLGIAIE